MIRNSSKEDIQMAKRQIKRCSILLIIRELQVKTTVRYHLTPTRMTVLKKKKKKSWGGYGEILYTVGRNVK